MRWQHILFSPHPPPLSLPRLTIRIVANHSEQENIVACAYQASLAPPGMSEGPYLAPSSPPLTPLPTNKMPFACSSLQRLWNKEQSSTV